MNEETQNPFNISKYILEKYNIDHPILIRKHNILFHLTEKASGKPFVLKMLFRSYYDRKLYKKIQSLDENKLLLPIYEEAGRSYQFFLYPFYHTLAEQLTTTGVSYSDICRLISDLSAAVTALHREQILHLDITPSNIFLDGTGHYLLGDFSSSRFSTAIPPRLFFKRTNVSLAGAEIVCGSKISEKTDCYLVCILLYALLHQGAYPDKAKAALPDNTAIDDFLMQFLHGKGMDEERFFLKSFSKGKAEKAETTQRIFQQITELLAESPLPTDSRFLISEKEASHSFLFENTPCCSKKNAVRKEPNERDKPVGNDKWNGNSNPVRNDRPSRNDRWNGNNNPVENDRPNRNDRWNGNNNPVENDRPSRNDRWNGNNNPIGNDRQNENNSPAKNRAAPFPIYVFLILSGCIFVLSVYHTVSENIKSAEPQHVFAVHATVSPAQSATGNAPDRKAFSPPGCTDAPFSSTGTESPASDKTEETFAPASQKPYLDLTGKKLKSLERNLTSKSEILFLSDNLLTDCDSLSYLTDTEELYLNHNRISSIGALKRLTKLRVLSLAKNNIKSLKPLSSLKKLTLLDISGNSAMEDFTSLKNLTGLRYLGITDTNVSKKQLQMLRHSLPHCTIFY